MLLKVKLSLKKIKLYLRFEGCAALLVRIMINLSKKNHQRLSGKPIQTDKIYFNLKRVDVRENKTLS